MNSTHNETKNAAAVVDGLSLIRGIPLTEEVGIGALTLGGYLKEITAQFGPREAAVMRDGDSIERWSYDDLWAHSLAVARALLACGVGKGTRVGILMTNRLEFLSSVFGTALAGGVATTMSTFSTAAEWKRCCRIPAAPCCYWSGYILKKDFAALLTQLEPKIGDTTPAEFGSLKFPFLRHIVAVDGEKDFGAIESWNHFLARGASVAPELVDATAASVAPADPGVLFFFVGLHRQTQRYSQRASRCVLAAVALAAVARCGYRCAQLVGERFFLVGQFRARNRRHAVGRRLVGAATDVSGRRSTRADAGRARFLFVRVAAPMGAIGRCEKLAGGRSVGVEIHRREFADRPPPPPLRPVTSNPHIVMAIPKRLR